MSNKNSEDLIKRLLAHDKEAIRSLYKSVLPQLVQYVKAKGGTSTDAQDVFQEGLIALYQNMQSPDFQTSKKLETYLFSICKYVWIKNLKKNGKMDGTFLSELAQIYGGSSDTKLYEQERQQLFYAKYDLLSDECKTILRMFFEGYSMIEIQEKLNISSKQYARKKKFHCKERLIELIKSDPLFTELHRNG